MSLPFMRHIKLFITALFVLFIMPLGGPTFGSEPEMKFPFPTTPEMTAISIGYHNKALIADRVLPRITVGKAEFKYLKHALGQAFTIPDTKVGRKSEPNQVEFNATEVTDSTEDHALDDTVPQDDIDNAPPNFDPLGNAVMMITKLIELGREKRVADLVFTAANYPAANKVTLAGAAQWSDFAGSDPIDDIMVGLDAPLMRPNVMTLGHEVYSKLVQHPNIVKAVNGNSGDSGIARRQAIAELFELEEVLVGQGRLNTAKPGQAVALSRVWGKHVSFTYRDEHPSIQSPGTFGFTAQFGSRVAGSIPEPKVGMRGSQLVRAGESVRELICASDFGYFIENAVA